MRKKIAKKQELARGKAVLVKNGAASRDNAFRHVIALIEASRKQTFQAVNSGLI